MAKNQSEEAFFEILKGICYFIAALGALLGFTFESIVWAGRRALRRAEETATMRKLEAHYDTDEVYEQNAQLARAAGFPSVSDFIDSYYDRLVDKCVSLDIIPARPVREALVIAAAKIYEAEELGAPSPNQAASAPSKKPATGTASLPACASSRTPKPCR